MANKKESSKKGGFTLAPITLSEPIKATDGFTNLVETSAAIKREVVGTATQAASPTMAHTVDERNEHLKKTDDYKSEENENPTDDFALTENELLRILDADSLNEIL